MLLLTSFHAIIATMLNHNKKAFPKPARFSKILGPSFVILALGLGSGEVILWPFLASNHGLGIIWGAFLGITFQYFINMEIERYALVKGESVFVGFHRRFRPLAYWFIFSTFIGFGLPGIIAASAQVFASVLGFESFKWFAILFLILIGTILSASKTVYSSLEKITKTVIFLGIPFIIVLVFLLSDISDWQALFLGFGGVGEGYKWLPSDISLIAFLAAFAYSGAGGNLNLTQSIYIKEKGFGMGKYSQKISGLFRKAESRDVNLQGTEFEMTEENISNFKKWWKKINIEHLLIFWLLGFVGIAMLMMLAFVTTEGFMNNSEGILFVINEGKAIGSLLGGIIGTIFLLVVSVMLFQTQLGILDSTSRIMAENAALETMRRKKSSKINLSLVYYIFVWSQISFGVILFLLDIYEPRSLIVIGAVINAIAMTVHVGLMQWLNQKELPRVMRPKLWRKVVMAAIFLFFIVFSVVTLVSIF